MTEKQGFNTAFYFLLKWYKVSKSDDIAELLSLMEPLDDGEPADPVMWDYWKESIEKVKKDGRPPTKKLS